MEIIIQGYWGAHVKSIESAIGLPEKQMEKTKKPIHICSIAINDYLGTVSWDGNTLFISDQGTVRGYIKKKLGEP